MAIDVVGIVHVPFLDHLADFFGITLPNDAGCQPQKVVTWKNKATWPLPKDTLLCGETWDDILNNNMLDPGVSMDTWNLAMEWIALTLNRANGVIPPVSILDVSTEVFEILSDCDVDSFEAATAAAHETTLGKFNNNDQDGLGFSCLLGAFTGDARDDLQYFIPILFYNHGATEALFRHAVVQGTINEPFSDTLVAQLPPELGLMMRGYTQYVYTLRDAAQPSIDQRPGLS